MSLSHGYRHSAETFNLIFMAGVFECEQRQLAPLARFLKRTWRDSQ